MTLFYLYLLLQVLLWRLFTLHLVCTLNSNQYSDNSGIIPRRQEGRNCTVKNTGFARLDQKLSLTNTLGNPGSRHPIPPEDNLNLFQTQIQRTVHNLTMKHILFDPSNNWHSQSMRFRYNILRYFWWPYWRTMLEEWWYWCPALVYLGSGGKSKGKSFLRSCVCKL